MDTFNKYEKLAVECMVFVVALITASIMFIIGYSVF